MVGTQSKTAPLNKAKYCAPWPYLEYLLVESFFFFLILISLNNMQTVQHITKENQPVVMT